MLKLYHNKILKIFILSLSALLAITLIALGIIYFQAQSFLNKNLSELVEKKSKGKYELEFNNLDLNFSHWGFEISNVTFQPTDSVLNLQTTSAPEKQLYTFKSPVVRFCGIKVLRLLFSKKLEIGEILISTPELSIHGQELDSEKNKTSMSSFLQELKPLVTKSFKSIKINKIELEHASFDFYNLLGDTRKMANAENITIGILNFYTDSILLFNPGQLFKTDDIYLKMHNYRNNLSDSIHTLHADLITYSLQKSQILVQNLELKPLSQRNTEKSQYVIHIPESKIVSSHISEFYRNNDILIDSMDLTGARIKYRPGLKTAKTPLDSIMRFDLYELIRDEFPSVSISGFRLRNTELEIFASQNDTIKQQKLVNINIQLKNFLLNSSSLNDTSRIFYSKNIDFSATSYELTLGDNVHYIKAGFLNLSTEKKVVSVKDIQLFPDTAGLKKTINKNTINGSCDSIRLDQFDFKRAYHKKRFAFKRINIFNPEVRITQNEISGEKDQTESPSFIYKLISNYAKGIYANQVVVLQGKVQLENKTGELQKGNIESKIKLLLNGFALDEISARKTDRLFFANQIELNFSNYNMQLVDHLHRLTIDKLDISTRNNRAHLQNLHLFPVSEDNIQELLRKYNRSELYEFTIPDLTLANADFHDAFFNKKLSVDTVTFTDPQIYYENFALLKQDKPKAEFEDLFQLLSNYLGDIHFGRLQIPDGTIRLINHNKQSKTISLDNHFSLGLENTVINKDQFSRKKLLFSENIDFTVHNHIIRLSDNVHVIKASEVGFSTRRKEVFATNARIYPETNSKGFNSVLWNVQLVIPEIRIQGIDIEQIYFDRIIDAESLHINTPEIRLYQKNRKQEVKDLKEFTFLLPKEIESLAIRQFKLTNGSLKVFSELGTQPYLLVQSDLQMQAQNVLIRKNTISGKPEFKKGDYTAQMVQFKFNPRNKNQLFSFDELTFSTKDRRIQAKQLLVKPRNKNPKLDQYILRIPTLTMNGFDMDKAYQSDQFLFESIIVDKPEFQLFNNAKDTAKFNPFKVNLYPHFESFANVFASGSIQVRNADISVFNRDQKKLQEKVSMNLSDVRIENQPSHGFMHARDFSFRIPDLKKEGKLYTYSIGETFYSSLSNHFSARNIRIIPKYDKENHQKQLGFQSDYYFGSIDSICINHPNIRQWFDLRELISGSVSVNGLNLNIFRDKRLPFDENRRPKMLQDMIKSVKIPFRTDSLLLQNARVKYTEQGSNEDAEGQISFSKIYAGIIPFTNIRSDKNSYPDFTIKGSATMMDSCDLKVNMNYMMNHPDNQFSVSGSASSFNIPVLNPVLEPLSSVSIRSGHVDRFSFNFTADKNQANGQLYFGYNDLKISVLEKKNGAIREAWFVSFLANSLMLKSKNPRGKDLLPEEISFRRDEKRSVINYWFNTLFSGIRNTLGLKDRQDDQETKKAE
ncbi:MAG: hypothetical protein WAO52_06305 [Prolixibacteraceae bacterium]